MHWQEEVQPAREAPNNSRSKLLLVEHDSKITVIKNANDGGMDRCCWPRFRSGEHGSVSTSHDKWDIMTVLHWFCFYKSFLCGFKGFLKGSNAQGKHYVLSNCSTHCEVWFRSMARGWGKDCSPHGSKFSLSTHIRPSVCPLSDTPPSSMRRGICDASKGWKNEIWKKGGRIVR